MKINIEDVVEVNYPSQRMWNGMQFRVKEIGVGSSPYFKGKVVKTRPDQADKYPVI